MELLNSKTDQITHLLLNLKSDQMTNSWAGLPSIRHMKVKLACKSDVWLTYIDIFPLGYQFDRIHMRGKSTFMNKGMKTYSYFQNSELIFSSQCMYV